MSHRQPALAAAIAMMLNCATFGGTTPSFQGLGDLPGGDFKSSAAAVSADGQFVTGTSDISYGSSRQVGYRWSAADGMISLGSSGALIGDFPTAISADGAVIVGIGAEAPPMALRWNATEGYVTLSFNAVANDVSADGSVIVGGKSGTGAYRWTAGGGAVDLGFGTAYGVSDDGSVVVGDDSGEAVRWTVAGGAVGLGALTPNGFSRAYDVSADGSMVVGVSVDSSTSPIEAFRWTAAGGMVGLGAGTGAALNFGDGSVAVSGDGSVIVGLQELATGDAGFIWDAVNGTRLLDDVFINDWSLDLTGWTELTPSDLSFDGKTIVGYGINPNGFQEAWIATLPEPSTCVMLLASSACCLHRRRQPAFRGRTKSAF